MEGIVIVSAFIKIFHLKIGADEMASRGKRKFFKFNTAEKDVFF